MIKFSYIKKKIKDVKISDIFATIPMFIAFVISPLYKKKFSKTWLICEEKKEARDNGYWFYKYIVENRKEQDCVYAIDKKSVDYYKVKHLGKVIQYGSLMHWIIYLTCEYNISSQKGGKPNAALCAFLELNGIRNKHNIFLQHGIIINDLKWLYADKSNFEMFITSTRPEKKFVEDNFGYKKGVIKLTGMPRFDNLHRNITKKNRIIIMPTWRSWLNLKSQRKIGLNSNFETSEYLVRWKELLESNRLNDLIDKHNLEIIFYPHRNMQRYLDKFTSNLNSKVIIASWKDYDLQELLLTSSIMITDYSSVFFDMVYMKKPIIFYQFDVDDFRNGQYEEGYFDYDNNCFGKSCKTCDETINELEKIISNGNSVSDIYLAEHKNLFQYYDDKNCERIFNEIKRMRK